jgi:hypothetical protein
VDDTHPIDPSSEKIHADLKLNLRRSLARVLLSHRVLVAEKGVEDENMLIFVAKGRIQSVYHLVYPLFFF